MRLYDVPLIQQEQTMSCWHASARMLWAYKYQQCINPLGDVYNSNTGVTPQQFIRLANELGLRTVPEINQSYGAGAIDRLLYNFGPIWAAGRWYGANHIIVITGVDDDGTLYVNDPGHPIPRVHDTGWFNQHVAADVANPLMFLP